MSGLWKLGRKGRTLSCTFPVRTTYGWGVLTAPVAGLAARRLRLRVPAADLGLPRGAGMPKVVDAVTSQLGDACVAELRGRRPGEPVRLRLRFGRASSLQVEGEEVVVEAAVEDALTPEVQSHLGVSVEEAAEVGAPAGTPSASAPRADAAPEAPARPLRRHRVTERVDCSLRVRFHTSACLLEARARDVSRSGVRVRLDLESLEVAPGTGLFELAKVLHRVLGDRCAAELRPAAGESTILKPLRLVRIGTGRLEGAVDLGFRFESPLSDADTRLLGVCLPAPVPARRTA